tara:strand:- start:919 stop:1296 length:378 start_codon:yes stop_codon:yes gene_type:complete
MLKAWWTETMGGFSNSYRRYWLLHQGYGWEVKLYDRRVAGESCRDLATELRETISREAHELDESPPLTRDRYGHEYVDHETRHALMSVLRSKERTLEKLDKGTFAPTHTIETDDDGNETVKEFRE